MVDCNKMKSCFSDYLDGEIPQSQRKEMEEHFAVCPGCEETIRQMRIIQRSLRQLPEVSTTPDFEQQLHQKIFKQGKRESIIPQPLQSWRLPAMGSALVLATVGLFLVFYDSPNPGENPLEKIENPVNTAAPQFPASRPLNLSTSQPAQLQQSSTLNKDSVRQDSLHINIEGFKQVSGN